MGMRGSPLFPTPSMLLPNLWTPLSHWNQGELQGPLGPPRAPWGSKVTRLKRSCPPGDGVESLVFCICNVTRTSPLYLREIVSFVTTSHAAATLLMFSHVFPHPKRTTPYEVHAYYPHFRDEVTGSGRLRLLSEAGRKAVFVLVGRVSQSHNLNSKRSVASFLPQNGRVGYSMYIFIFCFHPSIFWRAAFSLNNYYPQQQIRLPYSDS